MGFLDSKVTIRVTGMSWYLQLFLYHCAKWTKTTDQERKLPLFTKEGDREKKSLNAIYVATALKSSGDVCSVMSPGHTGDTLSAKTQSLPQTVHTNGMSH